MSTEALKVYNQAHRRQLLQNEARHIRTKVYEARQATHLAGGRWPFELLQNALDAGPREERDSVTIAIRSVDRQVTFEHDGAAFTSQDLAALLSGGSSKDFGSEETTGRFGTGFLVTHVLAEQTSIVGLLQVGDDHERFSLVLDRGGDEDQILANIESCNDSIGEAEVLANIEQVPSATFRYLIDDGESLQLGVSALRSALPYLFGTRSRLGEVTLELDNQVEIWTPGELTQHDFGDYRIFEREIRLQASVERQLRIVKIAEQTSQSAALVLLERSNGTWEVIAPDPLAPRIYRQYPLRDSIFLPVNFVKGL